MVTGRSRGVVRGGVVVPRARMHTSRNGFVGLTGPNPDDKFHRLHVTLTETHMGSGWVP